MNDGGYLSLTEAAHALGVSTRHARRLAQGGAITKVGLGLVDADSVNQYLTTRHPGNPRAWDTPTAWAAIALLSGETPRWTGGSQTSRLRARLRGLDSHDLAIRTRNRAQPRTYTAHRAALPHLREVVTASDPTLVGLTATMDDTIDGYIDTTDLVQATRTFGLREDSRGRITLRVTDFDHTAVKHLASTIVVAALDSTTSTDPRARSAGLRALDAALENYG